MIQKSNFEKNLKILVLNLKGRKFHKHKERKKNAKMTDTCFRKHYSLNCLAYNNQDVLKIKATFWLQKM